MSRPMDIAFSCNCGQVQGTLAADAARSGTHLLCHCRDCRAALLYLEQSDPAPDGVGLFQTTPDQVHFEAGADRLAAFRLGPKGPFRWYATCCKAPLFITLSRANMPFSSILVDRVKDRDALGPVRAQAFIQVPGGTAKHKGAAAMVWRLARNMGAARLSGRWKQTPFFDPQTGTPSGPVHVLTKAERDALYP